MKAAAMAVVLALGISACTTNSGDGSVKVNCAVAEDGRLTDCRIISEQPKGMGFGEAVLENIATTQARVRLEGANQPGQRVEFTTHFRED